MPPTAWTRPWGSDAAYRRVQSLAENVRGPIQVYRGSETLTIPYFDPTLQHIGVDHRVWMRSGSSLATMRRCSIHDVVCRLPRISQPVEKLPWCPLSPQIGPQMAPNTPPWGCFEPDL